MNDRVRISFHLHVDENGYPPVAVETLWGIPVENGYEIDSIPFLTRGATFGDTVQASANADGTLWFKNIVRRSLRSLVRVVFFDEYCKEEMSKMLNSIGCFSEYMKDFRVMSIDVPQEVDYLKFLEILKSGAEKNILDYEEVIIRH